eukprot:TRINITY_DN11715_c1_g1_i1.p1 TRINITY_DN11715_c1_g1~~TRINITY_DN11715_c1_g1_i1.p1  ORF type:complete len:299 (+),score=51.01 TRINITY_DN11715_c1_g1_i1:42-938(+)
MAVEDGLLPEAFDKQGTRVALLEHSTKKRVENLEYLKTIFESESEEGVLWMNCVRIRQRDLDTHFDEENRIVKGKLASWFGLGLSLSGVLEIPVGVQFVKAVEVLLQEYEYQYSSHMERFISGFRGSNSSSGEPAITSPTSPDIVPPNLPQLFAKTGTSSKPGPSYRFLSIPAIPMKLNHREVILCLCTSVVFVYRKFLDSGCMEDKSCLKKILNIDKKLKHHFFGLLSREIEKLAETIVRKSQKSVFQLFDSFHEDPGKPNAAGLLSGFTEDITGASSEDDEYDNSPTALSDTEKIL